MMQTITESVLRSGVRETFTDVEVRALFAGDSDARVRGRTTNRIPDDELARRYRRLRVAGPQRLRTTRSGAQTWTRVALSHEAATGAGQVSSEIIAERLRAAKPETAQRAPALEAD